MKKAFLVVFLGLVLVSCQKSNNIVVENSTKLIDATQLVFVGKDSVDIANSVNVQPVSLVIEDSFLVTLSSTQGFSYLDVNVANDSGTVLLEKQFATIHGDSIGGSFSFVPATVYVGELTYSFTPFNTNGAPGSYETKVVQMYNSQGRPPVVDTVTAPDSIQTSSTDTIIIDFYAKVHDPFGLGDIQIVYFNTTQPDGNPSTHNPYHMFDDGGASGDPTDADQTANDGTFTYQGQLPPGTTKGTYIFTFYAVNRGGVASSPFTHKIKVY